MTSVNESSSGPAGKGDTTPTGRSGEPSRTLADISPVRLAGSTSGPAVTFWGAAQQVTGSMHLVEIDGQQILLDCGLYLGHRSETDSRNRPFPFEPRQVRAVVLSHAHIDHCGNLPNLVRQGFSGPIYCTPPTRDLLSLMLIDSARIHEEDAFLLRVLEQSGHAGSEPLYTRADARRTVEQCVAVPYEQEQEIHASVRFRFVDAGHILGSAMIAMMLRWRGRLTTLTFTGDLGRPNMTFLRPPAPVPPADLLICESTYGGRLHEPLERTLQTLEVVVQRTLARGGKVLVPAFSLGRSQLVVHYLQKGIHNGRLPPVPIFVDSPLATDIAEVYLRHANCLREGPAAARVLAPSQTGLGPEKGSDPLNARGQTPFPVLSAIAERPNGAASDAGAPSARVPGKNGCEENCIQYVRSREESRTLSRRRDPCIVVASGGMCEGGRILHHLQHNIDDPRCSVVLVSYQSLQSLGRKLLARGPKVRFLGRSWNKWADIIEVTGFSGHADHQDFLTMLGPLAGRTARVRLVHGDPEQAEALASALREQNFADVAMPRRGETVPLF